MLFVTLIQIQQRQVCITIVQKLFSASPKTTIFVWHCKSLNKNVGNMNILYTYCLSIFSPQTQNALFIPIDLKGMLVLFPLLLYTKIASQFVIPA